MPCGNPKIPHNWTRRPPLLHNYPLLAVAPYRPSSLLSPTPRPPPPSPFLKADCCIVVVVASQIEVVVVIASPPLQTYRPEQQRAEMRKTPWRQSHWRLCSMSHPPGASAAVANAGAAEGRDEEDTLVVIAMVSLHHIPFPRSFSSRHGAAPACMVAALLLCKGLPSVCRPHTWQSPPLPPAREQRNCCRAVTAVVSVVVVVVVAAVDMAVVAMG